MMDPQTLINVLGGALLTVGGWFAKAIWDAVGELKDDVHQIEIDLPTTYLRKDEFQEGIRQIREDLQIVFMKIDTLRDMKADK